MHDLIDQHRVVERIPSTSSVAPYAWPEPVLPAGAFGGDGEMLCQRQAAVEVLRPDAKRRQKRLRAHPCSGFVGIDPGATRRGARRQDGAI
jgi:hypothetical protein